MNPRLLVIRAQLALGTRQPLLTYSIKITLEGLDLLLKLLIGFQLTTGLIPTARVARAAKD